MFKNNICGSTLIAQIGDDVVYVCHLAINPEPLSFSLEIPGQEERIRDDNPGEKFNFRVEKSEDTSVSNSYAENL